MSTEWSQEEKDAYVAEIKLWKSKLVKVPNKNIYLHPECTYKAWYAVKSGKYWKHKAFAVIDGVIKYTKNNETEELILSNLVDTYLNSCVIKGNESPFY